MNDLLPLLSYSLLMSATPGPNNILLTTSGANFGYRRSLPHLLGVSIGGGVQTWLACMGLGTLLADHPAIHDALRIAGALFLLWMAWKLTTPVVFGTELAKPVGFFEAAAFQFVNPKTWLKSVTVATVFMPVGMPTGVAALLVLAVTLATNFPCISMWTLFGAGLRRVLVRPGWREAFNAIMAGSLAVLAVLLLTR
jgi:threonine/homoserine/homoserine lactone efflux protein